MSAFNEENRFGSAEWENESKARSAGLFDRAGPHIGYWDQTPIHLDGDAPMITIGGAGSGKLRDLLAYVVCNSPGIPMLSLDPRGELGAISIHVHAGHEEYAYFWNPVRPAACRSIAATRSTS